MRIGIIGSRNIEDLDIDLIIKEIPDNCTEIVSGGAKGIDTYAQIIAEKLDVPIKVFLPEYEKYGKAAAVKRNKQIVEYSDIVIAVWDYESKGTRNSILESLKTNKKVRVIII